MPKILKKLISFSLCASIITSGTVYATPGVTDKDVYSLGEHVIINTSVQDDTIHDTYSDFVNEYNEAESSVANDASYIDENTEKMFKDLGINLDTDNLTYPDSIVLTPEQFYEIIGNHNSEIAEAYENAVHESADGLSREDAQRILNALISMLNGINPQTGQAYDHNASDDDNPMKPTVDGLQDQFGITPDAEAPEYTVTPVPTKAPPKEEELEENSGPVTVTLPFSLKLKMPKIDPSGISSFFSDGDDDIVETPEQTKERTAFFYDLIDIDPSIANNVPMEVVDEEDYADDFFNDDLTMTCKHCLDNNEEDCIYGFHGDHCSCGKTVYSSFLDAMQMSGKGTGVPTRIERLDTSAGVMETLIGETYRAENGIFGGIVSGGANMLSSITGTFGLDGASAMFQNVDQRRTGKYKDEVVLDHYGPYTQTVSLADFQNGSTNSYFGMMKEDSLETLYSDLKSKNSESHYSTDNPNGIIDQEEWMKDDNLSWLANDPRYNPNTFDLYDIGDPNKIKPADSAYVYASMRYSYPALSGLDTAQMKSLVSENSALFNKIFNGEELDTNSPEIEKLTEQYMGKNGKGGIYSKSDEGKAYLQYQKESYDNQGIVMSEADYNKAVVLKLLQETASMMQEHLHSTDTGKLTSGGAAFYTQAIDNAYDDRAYFGGYVQNSGISSSSVYNAATGVKTYIVEKENGDIEIHSSNEIHLEDKGRTVEFWIDELRQRAWEAEQQNGPGAGDFYYACANELEKNGPDISSNIDIDDVKAIFDKYNTINMSSVVVEKTKDGISFYQMVQGGTTVIDEATEKQLLDKSGAENLSDLAFALFNYYNSQKLRIPDDSKILPNTVELLHGGTLDAKVLNGNKGYKIGRTFKNYTVVRIARNTITDNGPKMNLSDLFGALGKMSPGFEIGGPISATFDLGRLGIPEAETEELKPETIDNTPPEKPENEFNGFDNDPGGLADAIADGNPAFSHEDIQSIIDYANNLQDNPFSDGVYGEEELKALIEEWRQYMNRIQAEEAAVSATNGGTNSPGKTEWSGIQAEIMEEMNDQFNNNATFEDMIDNGIFNNAPGKTAQDVLNAINDYIASFTAINDTVTVTPTIDRKTDNSAKKESYKNVPMSVDVTISGNGQQYNISSTPGDPVGYLPQATGNYNVTRVYKYVVLKYSLVTEKISYKIDIKLPDGRVFNIREKEVNRIRKDQSGVRSQSSEPKTRDIGGGSFIVNDPQIDIRSQDYYDTERIM